MTTTHTVLQAPPKGKKTFALTGDYGIDRRERGMNPYLEQAAKKPRFAGNWPPPKICYCPTPRLSITNRSIKCLTCNKQVEQLLLPFSK